MSRRGLGCGAAAVVLLGLGAEWAALQRGVLQEPVGAADLRRAAGDLLAGWMLGASGLVVWWRRPGHPLGPLLAASGVTWFLGTFADSGLPWLAGIGAPLVLLHRGPLFHALVTYPSGRAAGRLSRVAIAAAYLTAAIVPLGERVAVPVSLLALAAIATRARRASARERLALRVPLAVTAALTAVLAIEAPVLYELVVGAGAAWIAADLLLAGWTRAAVAGLVVELGRGWAAAPLEQRLAHALGDPSVRLGYRIPGAQGFVDAGGHPLDVATAGSHRRVTYLGGADPIAALVHDQAVVNDPALLESVAAAARIAVSNVQLQAEVRSRVDELAASRRRIVEAADAERRQFEHQLSGGVEARLAAVGEALARCPAGPGEFGTLLAETVGELTRARAELREFARGVHPHRLGERGLDAALAELVDASRLPVDVSPCGIRFAPAAEAVAYFVCAEALANAGKYASATRVSIDLSAGRRQLSVTVTDDGRGGADPAAGAGLRGLRDRVEALGGVLTVDSAPERGTRVRAVLPL